MTPKVRGVSIHESCILTKPEEYENNCSFITRVQYLFEDSLFRSSYGKMCDFQKKMTAEIKENYVQNLKANKVIPVSVLSWYEAKGDEHWYWRTRTVFKGDITSILKQENLAKDCGLKPRGSEIISYEYCQDSNATIVGHKFDGKVFLFVRRNRAEHFEESIKKQIKSNKKRELNSERKTVSPIFVSSVPVCQKDGYQMAVRYDGNWDNYSPKFVNHFEYNPFGSKVIKSSYDQANNVSTVVYMFRHCNSDKGAKRAWRFIDKIKSQICMAEQSENIK